MASAARNLAHRVLDVGLFEIGRVFVAKAGQELPEESFRLGVVLSGLMAPASWWAGEQPVSLSHIKGAAEYLAQALDLTGVSFETAAEAPPYLDPAEYCQVILNGEALGEMGRLDKRTAANFDLDRPVYLLDLNFDRLAELAPREKVYAPLPRYPELVRDVALVVAESLPAGEMLSQARAFSDPWLQSVEIFDVYRGKPLDKGQKSLGLRFTYRAGDRTLTEEEVTPGYQALGG